MNISQLSKISAMSFPERDVRQNYAAISEERSTTSNFTSTPRKLSDQRGLSALADRQRTKSMAEGLQMSPQGFRAHKMEDYSQRNGGSSGYRESRGSTSSNSSDSTFNRPPQLQAAASRPSAFTAYSSSQKPIYMEAGGIPRQNSSSSGSSSANIGAYNAMTRQTTAGPAVHRPVSVAEFPVTSESSSIQRHLPPRSQPDSINPYDTVPSHNASDMHYSPSHVRSLSQQVNNIQQKHSQDYEHYGYRGHQPPVPPPRRSRPMSAGPLRSSGSSAFSVPPQRSLSPTEDARDSRATSMPPDGAAYPPRQTDGGPVRPKIMSRPESQLGRSGSSSGRMLPQTPGDSRSARPGSTPPRPQGSKAAGEQSAPKPNSVWYEYGCL